MERFAAPSRALMTAAIALAISQSGPVSAAPTDDELRELREQVRQLRDLYERKITELEGRLRQAEQAAQPSRAQAPSPATGWPGCVAVCCQPT